MIQDNRRFSAFRRANRIKILARVGLLSGGLMLLAGATAAFAQDPSAAPAPSEPLLPVRDVTLFSSGVSYTVREGQVNGDASIPLTFRTTQINDILKSMVLLDTKGTVRPAIYAAKDPIGRTLQSFAVDVSQPTDRVSLLNRLKGARVAIEGGGTVIAAATTTEKFKVEGRIVGVDKESSTGRGIQGDVLSILGDSGLESVRLDEVRSIQFLDEATNREFREALALQASGSDDKRRQVTLRFDGQGRRTVRVGYVSEAPLWKISYRLLIGGQDGVASAKPYLQGWALVENTTDEDWNNVRLSLISGRPISFIQDLYQPLYLPRPVVPPDVVASPYPQIAEADVEKPKSAGPSESQGQFGGGGFGGIANRGAGHRGGAGPVVNGSPDAAFAMPAPADLTNTAESVQAAASGQQVGELFQYTIKAPVTLPRQQAAMIPVVAQDIAGDKVSIYNSNQDPRFPLNAFRIRNNTTLHLKAGPITIFDDGAYAGDARMEDVAPGATRLVTYAVDLAVTGECVGPQGSSAIVSVSVHQDQLLIKRKERQMTTYTLTSKADKPRLVIVEAPYDPHRTLVKPTIEPTRTASNYRFEVNVPPGETKTLTVITEALDGQQYGVRGMNLQELEYYSTSADIPTAIKEALHELLTRRNKIKAIQDHLSAAQAEIASITADQDRVHKNMIDLDRNSALYKRYAGQLDAQETEIQAVRTEAERLRAAAANAEQDLKTYISSLNINVP